MPQFMVPNQLNLYIYVLSAHSDVSSALLDTNAKRQY